MTGRFTASSRERRYRLFERLMTPRPDDRILDVGVTDSSWRYGNFLEAQYPNPSQITAVAHTPMPTFAREHPQVELVIADGRALPFADKSFDIGFSNAVIEHVGNRTEQAQFVAELVRTCRRVFLSTPNRYFPVDPHTLLPFIHWLNQPWRGRLYRALRQGRWSEDAMLNPLGPEELRRLFPAGTAVRIVNQRVFGISTVLIAVVD
jgi:SAM-dependent methyltransferase